MDPVSNQNKFKQTAATLRYRLERVGIPARVEQASRFHNSIYMSLGSQADAYRRIRLSDHNTGGATPRYSLRSDLKQSKKETKDGKEYFMYCLNDLPGLVMRIKKDSICP